MAFRVGSHPVLLMWIAAAIVFPSFSCAEGKGGGSSGGGGGGGRGGSGGKVGGYYGISRGGKGLSTGKKVALGAAVGVAGYAAYQSHHRYPPHRFHTNSLDNPAFKSGGGGRTILEGEEDEIRIQESSYYNRSDGFGMSAFALIALILGIISLCTLIWYCMEIGLPLWRDRENGYTRPSSLYSSKEKEGHPLQETPSTATPSP